MLMCGRLSKPDLIAKGDVEEKRQRRKQQRQKWQRRQSSFLPSSPFLPLLLPPYITSYYFACITSKEAHPVNVSRSQGPMVNDKCQISNGKFGSTSIKWFTAVSRTVADLPLRARSPAPGSISPHCGRRRC